MTNRAVAILTDGQYLAGVAVTDRDRRQQQFVDSYNRPVPASKIVAVILYERLDQEV